MTTLEDVRAEFSDWQYAIEVACRDSIISVGDGRPEDAAAFTNADVAAVIAAAEGENDGEAWCAVVRLADGRYVAFESLCDYSGWG